jgi:glycosyltransferase involved in cell wall biosynthesis
VNGLLVARDDLDGLVRMVELLLMDMERRKLLGEEGRRSIEEHYTLERMAEETAEIYDEILNAN